MKLVFESKRKRNPKPLGQALFEHVIKETNQAKNHMANEMLSLKSWPLIALQITRLKAIMQSINLFNEAHNNRCIR